VPGDSVCHVALEGDIVIPENTSEWLKKEKVRKP
jgi:hypothetical protein